VAVALAVLAAFPFGWGLGVLAAYLIAGPNLGQLPLMTVPVAIVASIVFATIPFLSAWTRLAIMIVGTGLFILLSHILIG
jgi:hypothetical protein